MASPAARKSSWSPTNRPNVRFRVSGTFPLNFAELISGDGARVYRERIDLSDVGSFAERTLTYKLNLTGRKWVRLEIWDIATDGAFTQPVWLAAFK